MKLNSVKLYQDYRLTCYTGKYTYELKYDMLYEYITLGSALYLLKKKVSRRLLRLFGR